MARAMLIEESTGLVTEVPIEEVDKNWFRRPANFKLGQFDKDLETKREPSMTVPNESYTIREILERFTRGVPMDISKQGVYEEVSETEIESFENLIDITEVEEKLSQVRSSIEDRKRKSVENTLSEGDVKGAEKSATDINKA